MEKAATRGAHSTVRHMNSTTGQLNSMSLDHQDFSGGKSSFSFTHNEGDAPTMQATMGHNALFARQVHIEVDLFAWPIVGSSLLFHSGELEEDQSITEHDGSLRNFYNNVTINVTGNFLP
ncbi:hypothetical protein KY290_013078 [Solanum tuberosum]|uniref:Uncharacterized protein n=1 Tax=Solanum tuberosum TaxID=4113 RepID=A0ABQ7VNM6_SOLTU|nr:hypothetical protein KY285_012854 [Solanum tuberosum]KAH0769097.1 hypothetical protein KY290_013078 [Solanum tuberosum]